MDIENRAIKRRDGTIEEISKFSDLVTHWQWIEKITTELSLAYIELSSYWVTGGTGLCEYIVLNILINYSQVFGEYNLYSPSDRQKNFLQLDSNGVIHYESGRGNKKTILYLMYKKVKEKFGGKWYDIRERKSIRKIMKTWLCQYLNNLIDDYSVSWSHTLNPWSMNYKI